MTEPNFMKFILPAILSYLIIVLMQFAMIEINNLWLFGQLVGFLFMLIVTFGIYKFSRYQL